MQIVLSQGENKMQQERRKKEKNRTGAGSDFPLGLIHSGPLLPTNCLDAPATRNKVRS